MIDETGKPKAESLSIYSTQPRRIVRFTTRPKDLALTFDDGPNPDVTQPILDLLDKYSVRATFFVIGRFARAYPRIVRDIAACGHDVGNHTSTHAPLTQLSVRQVETELFRCQDVVGSAVGSRPLWMRPPFGLCGPQIRGPMLRAGLKGIALWSVACGDWNVQPAQTLVVSLAEVGRNRREGGGDIVLLHDGDYRKLYGDRGYVVDALRYWLPRWRDIGHEFVTISGLFQ